MFICWNVFKRGIEISSTHPVARCIRFPPPSPSEQRQAQKVEPARPKCIFIDESAIEFDGECGDLTSTATTPEVSNVPLTAPKKKNSL